ncbi:AmmeMemoRadiSam system radical SAM enzyme [Patescibacteria group bacterium]|nr:AmmeMemoRadiSam system radical SAM enzyme [Patescibacteria group bacterium]
MALTPAKFYKQLPNNAVQCQLCNHFCAIKDGQAGVCRARKNQGGKLYSLVYGYPAALNIDPIEKKPLFHFQPGSFSYSLGTLGCNFSCANCQNWDISQAKDIENKVKMMDFAAPEKIVAEAIVNGCKSISYTYIEPTIFTEYALDIMKLAKENGLKNVWVSNGFMSAECLEAIIPYLDAINVDLKSMDDEFYKNNCNGLLKPVLDNLKTIKQADTHLEITTLIIPALSDDEEMLEKAAEFIASELDTDTPWHLSKFSSAASWKLKDLPDTSDGIIYRAYEIGKDAGLKYIYVGNMPGDQKENTYCPKCGELVIRRLNYHIERYDSGGRCPNCDKSLDIVD